MFSLIFSWKKIVSFNNKNIHQGEYHATEYISDQVKNSMKMKLRRDTQRTIVFTPVTFQLVSTNSKILV